MCKHCSKGGLFLKGLSECEIAQVEGGKEVMGLFSFLKSGVLANMMRLRSSFWAVVAEMQKESKKRKSCIY